MVIGDCNNGILNKNLAICKYYSSSVTFETMRLPPLLHQLFVLLTLYQPMMRICIMVPIGIYMGHTLVHDFCFFLAVLKG